MAAGLREDAICGGIADDEVSQARKRSAIADVVIRPPASADDVDVDSTDGQIGSCQAQRSRR